LQNDEGSALGAAMLAAYAVESFKSVEEAAEAWIKPRQKFTPDKASCPAFEAKYRQYLSLYQSIKPYHDFIGAMQ
jgi:ribulose kinase